VKFLRLPWRSKSVITPTEPHWSRIMSTNITTIPAHITTIPAPEIRNEKGKKRPLRVGVYKPREGTESEYAGQFVETNGAKIKLADGRKLWAAQLSNGQVIGVHRDEVETLRGKDLMNATMKFIEELELFYQSRHRKLWNQGDWRMDKDAAVSQGLVDSEANGTTIVKERCGTPMCFAGWAATLAGCEFTRNIGPKCTSVVHPGTESYADMEAAELMDLSWENQRALFGGANTLDDLRWKVDAINRGEYLNPYDTGSNR
jgi:hypothetical protein